MANEITVDSAVYQQKLFELRRELGPEFSRQILQDESKQFLKQIIKVTPPFFPGGASGNRRKLGENAVAGDIGKTMRPLRSDAFTRNPDLRKRWAKIERKKDYGSANAIIRNFKHLGPNNGFAPFSPSLHTDRRGARGRVSATRPWFMLGASDAKQLRAYIKLVQGRVGVALAGWGAACRSLGISLPSFAARHGSAASGFVQVYDKDPAHVVISNRSSKWPRLKEQARYVMQGREKAIASKVQRLIHGKAVNLGFATFLGKK